MNETLPTDVGETRASDEPSATDYRVIHPGLLDRPLFRAALLGTILLVVGFFVATIRWEISEDYSGEFQKINIPPVPPAPPPPSEAGDSQFLTPGLPAPPMPAMTVPTVKATFVLPKLSKSIVAEGLADFSDRFGKAGGLGNGLGTQLSGLLFQLPVMSDGICDMTDVHSLTINLSDDAVHTCQMHVRGVVEVSTYDGGRIMSFLCAGGTPNTGDWNIYELDVSDPPQIYFLNAGQSGLYYVYAINYKFNIWMRNGSVVTLKADSVDGREIPNQQQLTVPEDDPVHPIAVKQPYQGQFIQVDAISIQ